MSLDMQFSSSILISFLLLSIATIHTWSEGEGGKRVETKNLARIYCKLARCNTRRAVPLLCLRGGSQDFASAGAATDYTAGFDAVPDIHHSDTPAEEDDKTSSNDKVHVSFDLTNEDSDHVSDSQPEGANGWERLKRYYKDFEKRVGGNEVDNIGVEEYGPHTIGEDAGKDWRGRGAFAWYNVPWIERPLIGQLEFPDGRLVDLREGDLPNREPLMPDFDEIAQKKPRVKRDKPVPYEQKYAGQDLREIDHWIAKWDTPMKNQMPPGGYPLPANITFDINRDPPSDHSDSDFYEDLRNEAFLTYGRKAIPVVKEMDKLMNYSGLEPTTPQFVTPVRGELATRFDAEGNLDGFVPMDFDEVDCDITTLSDEQLNMKLWQYATDGRGNATREILRAGADVNAVSEFTHTALHYAARKGWTPVLSVLLEHGADVNVTNEVGMTPLHYAAYYNHTPAVWMLLRAGADMNATTIFEFTPEDYAQDYGYKDMQILFRAFSRNASDVWEYLYGDEYRESHHPGTFNSTPTGTRGKYEDFWPYEDWQTVGP